MRFSLIILFLSFQISLFATLAAKDGYYVPMDGDTVYGKIKVRIDYLEELFYARIQYGAFYEDSTGNLLRLKPEEVSCFSFYHKYQHVKFVSMEYFPNYRMFLHELNEEGAVKLYAHYKNIVDTRTDYGALAFYLLEFPASSERDLFFMVKNDGSTVKYGKYSGKKNIAVFFLDYPELHKKIQRGLYGYTSVYRMVREYNSWYREKNQGNTSFSN